MAFRSRFSLAAELFLFPQDCLPSFRPLLRQVCSDYSCPTLSPFHVLYLFLCLWPGLPAHTNVNSTKTEALFCSLLCY